MNKRGKWQIVLAIVLVVVLVVTLFLYFALVGPDYSSRYDSYKEDGSLVNPVSRLSTEDAVEQFDDEFIYYLLYQIGAYNLKAPPLSSDYPKISINVGDSFYNAEIKKGTIIVSEGDIENPDIRITTTKLEAVLMLQDENYIQESFNNGNSAVELLAPKAKLFAKGYLNLYTNLTGKSITGNVIRIYVK